MLAMAMVKPAFAQEVPPDIETNDVTQAEDTESVGELVDGEAGPAGSSATEATSREQPDSEQKADSALDEAPSSSGALGGTAEPEVESNPPPSERQVDLSHHLRADSSLGPRVAIGAFADFGLHFVDDPEAMQLEVGQLVIHSTAILSNEFSTFAEVTLDSVPEPGAYVQRLLFNWERSDALKVSAGRYHLPMTWWNATAHHGLWLQTTAERPRMLDYENAFVPNHAMGLFVTGQLPFLRQLGARYNIGVSGGGDDHHHTTESLQSATTGMAGHGSHDTEGAPVDVTLNGVVAVEPRGVPYLRIGISGLMGPDVVSGSSGRTNIAGAHIAYTSERPEFIVEALMVSHMYTADGHHGQSVRRVHHSGAGYAQLAWRLRGAGQKLKPYTRVEKIAVQEEDPNLIRSSDYLGTTAGLRIDIVPTLALKIDGTRQFTLGSENAHWSGNIQLSAAW